MRLKKVQWKRFFYLLLIIIVFSAGIYFLIPGFIRIQQLLQQENELKNDLYEKENAKAGLELYLHKLKSDPVMIEKVARDEIGMSKDNEIIYKFDQ